MASDLKRLAALLKAACTLFGREFTDDLVAVWASLVGDRDIGELEKAARAYFLSGRRMPSPADLLNVGGDEGLKLDAELDWTTLRKNAPLPREKEKPVLRRAIAAGALEIVGGHMMLRDLTRDDEPHRRREFVEAYIALYHREQATAAIEGAASDKLRLPS